MKIRSVIANVAILAVLAFANGASGQEPIVPAAAATKTDPIDRIQLFDSLERTSDQDASAGAVNTYASTMHFRQARAIEKANQRLARMEYNLWIGYNPSRPQWSAIPMTQSRYAPRQFHVPIYVYGY